MRKNPPIDAATMPEAAASAAAVSHDSPRIVGIGASAGGLAALEQFFAHVPPHSGLAFVVVQHMDPTHKALLCTLLQRVTPMTVRDASDGEAVQADNVYVIPPDRELTVVAHHLQVRAAPRRGVRLPIDVLLHSLAVDQQAGAIGVVLSGMGSDGLNGLQAIREVGGLTLAQDPATAQYRSMPESAIAAGCVDRVARPAAMPPLILAASPAGTPPLAERDGASDGASDDQLEMLGIILALVRTHCKHDLSLYKSSTLLRRIARRVTLHGLASMDAYADLLRHSPQELEMLFAEMLIGVTGFFRDTDLWRALRDELLPDLLVRSANGTRLRAWVVGCSTGEEAYSLAMVFCEAMDALPPECRTTLQIFATDLSHDAIALARKGVYSAAVTADLDASRRERFFDVVKGGLQIKPEIRALVLFAHHDVLREPPFTKLDLLFCRNVLIYFKAELQQRLMGVFHFSLRPGGALILGSAETTGRAHALFTPLMSLLRIYRRSGDDPGVMRFPVNHAALSRQILPVKNVAPAVDAAPSLQTLVDQKLLQEHVPAAALVNEEGDILYLHGTTGRYLEPVAGKANWNVHAMAPAAMRAPLAQALRQALQTRAAVELADLPMDDDLPRSVTLVAQVQQAPRPLAGLVLLTFREGTPPAPGAAVAIAAPAGRGRVARAAQTAAALELKRSRAEIQALRLKMQAVSDDLQALNEALQAANESLQSANEELTSAQEETQSLNEELQTTNGELQTRLDDLALAHADMQNLLDSTDIATLFLDNELQVRRFTPSAESIFNLRQRDVGRPLCELVSRLRYPTLHSDALETLRSLVPTMQTIETTDGRWLSVRIMPYRTLTNLIQGVVLTLVDITVAKQLELRLREGHSESETAVVPAPRSS